MLTKLLTVICILTAIPTVFSLMCYKGTVKMVDNQNPQGYPTPYDCGPFVQFCTKNLLNQRQQNWDTLTTIVYDCDTQYSSTCRYNGCTYSVNGGSSCCCDSYLCNGTSTGYSNPLVILLCALIATGKFLL